MKTHFTAAVAVGCLWVLTSIANAETSVSMSSDIGGPYSVRARNIKEVQLEYKFRSTVRQQTDFSCGSAAVATLLTYHFNQPISEDNVIRAMYEVGDQAKIRREGFSLLDMKRYLEARGYRADGFEIPKEKFDKLIAANIPFIVLIRDSGYNHFVVVKGVQGEYVLLGDPAKGARIVSRQDFDAMWPGRVAFLVQARNIEPRFNVAEHWKVSPQMALGQALNYDSLAAVTLLRRQASDY